jgi:lambda family phage portal protein
MLQALRRWFQPAPAALSGAQMRRFDGAVVDRLTASWTATNNAIDRELRNDLDKLRARSRDLSKNNEYATKFLRMVRNNVAGKDGFTLQARSIDPSGTLDSLANTAIENAFWRWGRPGRCEVTGKLSFPDLVRTLAVALARDGEFLVRRVRGRAAGEYGFQLQVLDIERLDTKYNRAATEGSNAIIMGVEVDIVGRPVAYHIFTTLPGEPNGLQRQRERVPADEIWHKFIPFELEQTRGVPWMHAAMRRINDLNGYREAAVIAARIGASKMGFFTSKDGQPPPNDGQDAEGNFVAQATPGEFAVLPDGYGFEKFDPAYPHDQFEAFVRGALRGIASALGVAYPSLGNDLNGVNFSSIRAGLLEEREEWIVIQNWFIASFLEPLFEEWLDMALLSGAIRLPNGSTLPASKADKFRVHTWLGRRWDWVDPLKDIQANVAAIEAGLASPQQVAASLGRDVEEILDDIAAFRKMAADRGVPLGPQQPAAAAAPASDDEEDEPADEERKSTMAMLGALRELAARPVNVQVAAPAVHVAPAEVRVHVEPTTVNVPAAEVRVDVAPANPTIHVEPSTVDVRVEPAVVNVEAPNVTVSPEVSVKLPDRKTVTDVERDSAGEIVRTVKFETNKDSE